jgi:Zn-dependent metalloprotease
MSDELDQLLKTSRGRIKFNLNAKTGSVAWIRGLFLTQTPRTRSKSAEGVARTFLEKNWKALSIPPRVGRWGAKVSKAREGVTQVVFRQRYKDVPVFGAGVAVKVGKDRVIHEVAINLADLKTHLPVKPRLNSRQAADKVRAAPYTNIQ